MPSRPVLRDKTQTALDELMDDHGFTSTDSAITYLLRQEGYDV